MTTTHNARLWFNERQTSKRWCLLNRISAPNDQFAEYTIVDFGGCKSCLPIAPDRYRTISLIVTQLQPPPFVGRPVFDPPFFGIAKSKRPFSDSASGSSIRLVHAPLEEITYSSSRLRIGWVFCRRVRPVRIQLDRHDQDASRVTLQLAEPPGYSGEPE